MADREPRPDDHQYYAWRTDYVRQGDVFRDVPLGYPFPSDALDHDEGTRKFLSGPFDSGFGLLVSPTCSFTAQGTEGKYAHAVRLLAPVLPLEHLVEAGAIKQGTIDGIRRFDLLVNYFYLPPIESAAMPESMALLYAAITVHHDFLEDRRVAQLAVPAAVHLKRQLAMCFGGTAFDHDEFAD